MYFLNITCVRQVKFLSQFLVEFFLTTEMSLLFYLSVLARYLLNKTSREQNKGLAGVYIGMRSAL